MWISDGAWCILIVGIASMSLLHFVNVIVHASTCAKGSMVPQDPLVGVQCWVGDRQHPPWFPEQRHDTLKLSLI